MTEDEQEQLVQLKGMLQSQHIRLEAQQRANPYSLSSVRLWERLIKATEREIQRLESHAPYPQIGGNEPLPE